VSLELDHIAWLRATRTSTGEVRVGVGDDAAVVDTPGSAIVVTTDLVCDGVHFCLETTTPERVGRKALAVNLSDVAAMAARPVAAFVSLLLPQSSPASLARDVTRGMRALAAQFQVPIAGGDTNTWPGKLVINVAVVGAPDDQGPLLRSGARPGDVLLVTGQLGGSLLGHHLDFTPRVHEALTLHSRYRLHAGLDLSDGLALDLRRLVQESGCGAEVFAASVPIAAAAHRLEDDRSALQHALGDGEDFELLLAVAPDVADLIVGDQPLPVPVTAVGRCVAGSDVWLVMPDGSRKPLPELGFQHQ
jgi:thiamine-monophosphate kinase